MLDAGSLPTWKITGTTLYRWCSDLGIDINEYRRPAVREEEA